MRRFLGFVFGFGLLGDIVAILVGPSMIRFWYQPPATTGPTMALDATRVLDYGMHMLTMVQLVGTGLGMLVGALISFLLWRRARRLAAASTAAAPGAGAPGTQAAPAAPMPAKR